MDQRIDCSVLIDRTPDLCVGYAQTFASLKCAKSCGLCTNKGYTNSGMCRKRYAQFYVLYNIVFDRRVLNFSLHDHQSEHLLKQVIMKITLCSTFFYNSATRYKICFPLFKIIILNITSSGDYFDLSNHLHR